MEENLFKYAFAPTPASGGFAGAAVLSTGVLSCSQSGIELVITAFSSGFSPAIVSLNSGNEYATKITNSLKKLRKNPFTHDREITMN